MGCDRHHARCVHDLRGEWSLRARVAAWFVRRFVRSTYFLLRKGWLLRSVPLGSKLYLSNVAVLERE